MQASQIIVLVSPLFFVLIALEYWLGRRRGRTIYRLNDALSSIGLGMLSQLVGVLSKAFTLGIYVWVYQHLALMPLRADSPWVWAGALLLYDLLYYWHHRFGHTVALFWAAHAVHHQSEDYNLSTALRQTSSGWIAGWIFYLPMAVIGVPPLVFAVVALIDLLYQYWVHTQLIGRLGWFDRWFCSPSNHRVHHAVNTPYLDKNYGGILIIWDRLFGTFQEELDAQPCVYGTREPLRSWNPWVANTHVYAKLWSKMRRLPGWRDKLRVWWEPAHWEPGAQSGSDVFDPDKVRRFDPHVDGRRQAWAAVLFLSLLAGTSAFLWFAPRFHIVEQLMLATGLALGLVQVGRLNERAGSGA